MIVNLITKYIGFDGLLHIVASSVIALALSFFVLWWMALLMAFAIGIGKELYDRISGKGCAELKDLICDLVGCVIGSL